MSSLLWWRLFISMNRMGLWATGWSSPDMVRKSGFADKLNMDSTPERAQEEGWGGARRPTLVVQGDLPQLSPKVHNILLNLPLFLWRCSLPNSHTCIPSFLKTFLRPMDTLLNLYGLYYSSLLTFREKCLCILWIASLLTFPGSPFIKDPAAF